MADDEPLLAAHVQLSETLRDVHYGHHIRIFDQPPDVVQLAKAVGLGIPFVVKGAAKHWPAIRKDSAQRWTNDYLTAKLVDEPVTVSVTGDGYADAVRWCSHPPSSSQPPRPLPVNGSGATGDGEFVFATPYEVRLPFKQVLQYLVQTDEFARGRPVAFCQLQNDCLRGPEYSALLDDVPDAVPSWASAVLGREPEAVNFWMGRHESVTTIHSDPFENIYTVIRGYKTFTMYPPCDAFFFSKQEFPTASWRACAGGATVNNIMPEVELVRTADGLEGSPNSPSHIPWIPITHPFEPAPLYSRFASSPKPFQACVQAGDQLYLPRGWLHHVEQREDEEGVCIAVNAWYEGWEGMGLSWGWSEYAQRMDELSRLQVHEQK